MNDLNGEIQQTPRKRISTQNLVLSFLHSILAVSSSFYTIYVDWKFASISILVSMVYFGIILFLEDLNFAMVAHHLIAISTALYLISQPKWNIVFVYFQTNEMSTPFMHLYKEFNLKWAGYTFAATFFISRIVFNSFYVVPFILACLRSYELTNSELVMSFFGLSFYLIQWFWFMKIYRSLMRSFKSKV